MPDKAYVLLYMYSSVNKNNLKHTTKAIAFYQEINVINQL